MSSERAWWRNPLALTAAGAVLLLLVAELGLGRASGAPSDGVLFLGRFHPLVVHLPIGIFVLVALGELATLLPGQRSRIDPVTGLVLPVLVVSAVVSFVLGHFLARSGDFPPQALGWHRRLAFAASLGSALSLAAWVRHSHDALHDPRQAVPSSLSLLRGSRSASRWAYRAALFGSLAVLSLGAHFGGTMTRGEAYLSKYAPGFLKPLLGGTGGTPVASSAAPKAEPVSEPRLLEQAVMPILAERCVSCHGPEKVKGGLRLDTLASLEKGGESGPAIVKGSAASSLLVKRLHLPLDDDERMPPKDKPQLSAEQIALIEFWIERGASNELEVRDLLAPVSARPLLEKALDGAPPPSAKATPPATGASMSGAPAAPEPVSATRSAILEGGKPEPANETPEAKAAPAPSAGVSKLAPAGPAVNPFSILAEKCEKCHGEIRQKGKLRVDSLAALLAGGSEGPSVVAGHPEKSPLIQRVRLPLSSDEHMPPSEETQLTAREVATLSSFVRGLSREAQPTLTLASSPAAGPATTAVAQSESPGGVSPPASDPPATGQPSEPEVTQPEKPAPAPAPSATPPSESADEPVPQAVNARGGCAACAVAPRPLDRVWGGATLGLLALGFWRRSRRQS